MSRVATLVLVITAGCRFGFESGTSGVDGGSPDGANDASADAAPDPAGLIFSLDSADVDGLGNPGTDGCPGAAPSGWIDLVAQTPGVLQNFADPACGDLDSGWNGDGTAADPHRLAFNVGPRNAVTFGTVAEADNFTVMAFARWHGTGRSGSTGGGGIDIYTIVAKGAAETEMPDLDINYMLGISDPEDAIAMEFEDSVSSNNHNQIGATPLSATAWYHLAVTYDQVEKSLYVNGGLDGSASDSAPVSSAINSILAVGADYRSTGSPGNGNFDGDIAIVRIFDRALDAGEIAGECSRFAQRFGGLQCAP